MEIWKSSQLPDYTPLLKNTSNSMTKEGKRKRTNHLAGSDFCNLIRKNNLDLQHLVVCHCGHDDGTKKCRVICHLTLNKNKRANFFCKQKPSKKKTKEIHFQSFNWKWVQYSYLFKIVIVCEWEKRREGRRFKEKIQEK